MKGIGNREERCDDVKMMALSGERCKLIKGASTELHRDGSKRLPSFFPKD
jgi:hypothetical protein